MMEQEAAQAAELERHCVDWRTGKAMVERGDAFWQEHERQRVESGMSVPEYCRAHELALSTYRHRISGRRRASNVAATATATATATTAKKPSTFVYLRTLLIQGAKAITLTRQYDNPIFLWVQRLRERVGWQKAVVALANKNAGILWAVMTREKRYDAYRVSSILSPTTMTIPALVSVI